MYDRTDVCCVVFPISEDLVILVPYVGQLFRVRKVLEAVQLRVLVSDRDREQMERAGLPGEGVGV